METALQPHVPDMPTWNPMGHVFALRRDPLAFFERMREVGDVVQARALDRRLFAVFHPDQVQHVLVDRGNNYTKQTRGYAHLRRFLGQGLLTSEGEIWRRQRRIAQPAFQQKRIVGFAQSMANATEDMLEQWDPIAKAGTFIDVVAAMSQLTLRIAGETLFSVDVSKNSDVVSKALDGVLSGFIQATTNPLAPYLPLPNTLRSRRGAQQLDKVVRDIIAQRRKEGGERDDLLGMFMSAKDEQTGEGMSDEQLRDEVLTMLLAGHETTANALGWTLFELSQHPEVDTRLGQELDTVMGQRPFSLDQLSGMVWTEQVLKESMRLHPPAWVESRKSIEADQLGPYPIPPGSFVFVCQYAIHRHPKLWVDPTRFDPERFGAGPHLCPDGSPRPRLAWLPFGAGQRKCIGEHFAMMEAKILTSLITRRYRFEMKPGFVVRHDPSVTLRPRDGLPMRLLRRDSGPVSG